MESVLWVGLSQSSKNCAHHAKENNHAAQIKYNKYKKKTKRKNTTKRASSINCPPLLILHIYCIQSLAIHILIDKKNMTNKNKTKIK